MELGTTRINGPDAVVAYAKELIPHPDYEDKYLANDIAVIKLVTPVMYSDMIQPACLPESGYTPTRAVAHECTISGWGQQDEYGETMHMMYFLLMFLGLVLFLLDLAI